jgi:serine/threonine protein kinase
MSSDIKERFGRYFILDHLVNGGMAKICRARFLGEQADRIVAIKMIQAQFSADESFKQMFMDEIKVTFGLLHPNIVQTYDYGIHKDQLFVAMEYCDGRNLKEYLNRLRQKKFVFPVEISVYIMSQVCQGLHYAHGFTDKLTGKDAHIIHRDISPHNIMLTYDGAIKVIDFGIAKAETNTESTQAGTIKGKLSYLAPEYLEGLDLDARYDIFSVGITLWEMLCSQKLFKAKNDLAVLKKIQECSIPIPSSINPNVPKELDEIVLKALSKDRNERYSNIDQLNRALIKFLYANFPDFNSSDLSYFAKELFKEEIKKDREKLFEYGKIDLMPYINEWKREGNQEKQSESAPTEQRREKTPVLDFGFDKKDSNENRNEATIAGNGAKELEFSKTLKSNEPLLKIDRPDMMKKGKRRSNGYGEKDKEDLRKTSLKAKFIEEEKTEKKRKVITYVASFLILFFIVNSQKSRLIKLYKDVRGNPDTELVVEDKEIEDKGLIRLTNFNIEKHKVFINNEKVKPNYLKEVSVVKTDKVIVRVEQRGLKHFIKELDFSSTDYFDVDIPHGEEVQYGYLFTSRGCQMKGKIIFELWGERRSEEIPHRSKMGISLPIDGDGRFPADENGMTKYTVFFQKEGETIERKLDFHFTDAGERIDLCDL